MSRRSKPLGLRREVLIFLPVAVLLLAFIAVFNLQIYRGALRELESERLQEAEALAARAAAELSDGALISAERLARLAPSATAIAVFDSSGRVLAQSGTPVPLDAGSRSPGSRDLRSFPPDAVGVPTVVAIAPFERNDERLVVQVDLPAPSLAAHRAGLRRMTYLNAAVLSSLLLLVLLFARYLLRPFESLLERARKVDQSTPNEVAGDEVAFLVETFERALEALDTRSRDDGDDIAVLERTLAPSLESGFMLLDSGGRVLAVNELGAALLEIEPPAQPVALTLLLERHPDLRTRIGDAVSRDSAARRHECEIDVAAGRRVIGLTVHPLRRDDGALRGFIVLYADLTAMRAEERQAQLDRGLAELGELSAGMAHELRNGLATLKGYLGLIEHGPDEDAVTAYLQEMRTESEHLERVLSDFLSFAQPGTARLEPISLADVVERASGDPALSDVDLRLEVESDLPTIQGDPQLLERTVRNLLHNAADAHRRAAVTEPIGVHVGGSPAGLTVRIVDAGPGLDDGIRERLFQPFASGRADGIGLGLALARRIARLHGGELSVADRSPSGVEATLRLPIQPGTQDSPATE